MHATSLVLGDDIAIRDAPGRNGIRLVLIIIELDVGVLRRRKG
jgi:hypothetical protein